jgi:plasmid stability protein
MLRMTTDETRITVRLPADLADALRQRAAAEDRSLNREVVFLLRQVLFPTVDADAYSADRRMLGSLPKYSLPRPMGRRQRGGGAG